MPTMTNFITNPSAEINTAGWTGFATTPGRSTSQSSRGNASFIVPSTGSNQGMTQTGTPATQGQTWSLSADMMGSGARTRMSLVERTGTGTFVTQHTPKVSTLTGQWARYTYTSTLTGPTTGIVEVRILSDHTDGTPFHVDAVLLQLGEPTDYFDGDSPNAVWTGTPHASASVLTIPDRRIFPVLKIGSPHIGPLRVGKA